MPADLRVVAVRLPSPLLAPCWVTVVVTIRNDGDDPPVPGPFLVAVQIGFTAEGPFRSDFSTVVEDPEIQRLGPRRTADIPVRVRFACNPTQLLGADVDPDRQIANNLHGGMPLGISVSPQLVPWLVTRLRVGLEDTAGTITWDPTTLCPNKTLVADVTVANEGCAASPPTTTDVTLEDPGIGPFANVVLQSQSFCTPSLLASQASTVQVRFRTPPGLGSGTLVIRARADAGMKVTTQCDRATLAAWVTKPIAHGAAPRLSLTLGGEGFLLPGQGPAFEWAIFNDCAEIGDATVRVLFGTTPQAIYKEQITIGLRASAGRFVTAIPISTAIANDFWSIGSKTLTLEVEGTGLDPGPYRTTLTFDVRPEPVDATWWTWALPPGVTFLSATWKSAFSIVGALTNRSLFSPMTVTSLDVLEHPTDVTGTASDIVRSPFGSVVGLPVLPAFGLSARWTMTQNWAWLTVVYFTEVGPQVRRFNYTPRIDLVDAFGNVYAGLTFPALSVTFMVPSNKVTLQAAAVSLISLGLATLALAAFLVATLSYPANLIAGAAFALVGMGCIISGTLFGYQAMDPPVPHFGPRTALLHDMADWELPEDLTSDRFHAMRTLFQLVVRVQRAHRETIDARGRAWAAFIDRDENARAHWRDRVYDALETLRRATEAVAETADEALGELHEIQAELLPEAKDVPAPRLVAIERDRLLAEARMLAERLRVPDSDVALIERVLTEADDERISRSLERLRSSGFVDLAIALQSVVDLVASDLREQEYLR